MVYALILDYSLSVDVLRQEQNYINFLTKYR
jgi:hypothetical protein